MNRRVYLETSVISYLTARPSRYAERAARQTATREWWATRRSFDLFASQFVVDEARLGHPEAAARRMAILQEIALLRASSEVAVLAAKILRGAGLPLTARADAVHFAIAAIHGLDILLTWNCAHIANATLRSRIYSVVRACGLEPPLLCTPFELL